ncbi:hypothetical protein HPP92_022746 [Vanilla planifolia]|uniref:F-box domain-containing protein n=1 Tax=Vanilla planifolia TaxID=51239 RepID=A0A835PTX9_VANPL|nr:hypothetical protein HPP92_022746 [Vanilla planifolia]
MPKVFEGAKLLMAAAKAAAKEAEPAAARLGALKGILKPLPVSPALRKFVGVPEISRSEAIKKIWDHIKLHQLQVPFLPSGHHPELGTAATMADFDKDDDQLLVDYVESSMLSDGSDQEEMESDMRPSKRPRINEDRSHLARRIWVHPATRVEGGVFSNIPSEVLHHIMKFLSSEDLISCSKACKFLSTAASDEGLWRRLYCMRWGLASPSRQLRACAWKDLYIQRDKEDMVEFVRNTPAEFKEYYIQMQAAKRSQAPLPSQVSDDHIILDRTVADQVSVWRSSRGFTDEPVTGHICSGKICTYSKFGDVFICEKTGRVHVCDDTCRELVWDQTSGLLVCTISGQCFERWLSPEEEMDNEQQQAGFTDEMEPFMGSGRFARAYMLGYNCKDEKELEAALRFC